MIGQFGALGDAQLPEVRALFANLLDRCIGYGLSEWAAEEEINYYCSLNGKNKSSASLYVLTSHECRFRYSMWGQ